MAMKQIYSVKQDTRCTSKAALEHAHALSLDPNRNFGVTAEYGLLLTDEWWENFDNGTMPREHIVGVVERVYEAGMDSKTGLMNTMNVIDKNGKKHALPIGSKDRAHVKLVQPGITVEVISALQRLKNPSVSLRGDGYASITVEVWIDVPE